jgi:hypothetical protein
MRLHAFAVVFEYEGVHSRILKQLCNPSEPWRVIKAGKNYMDPELDQLHYTF